MLLPTTHQRCLYWKPVIDVVIVIIVINNTPIPSLKQAEHVGVSICNPIFEYVLNQV